MNFSAIFLTVFLICSVLFSKVENAKILGIFHVPMKSHHILGSALLKGLAKQGHDVTMISPFPLKNPPKNYKDIYLDGMLEFKEKHMKAVIDPEKSTIEKLLHVPNIFSNLTEIFWTNTEVQDLIKNREKYDIVIQIMGFNDGFLGLAHHLGASSILFSPVRNHPMIDRLVANPTPLSYVPNLVSPFELTEKMSFFQRATNVIVTFGTTMAGYLVSDPFQEKVMRKYLPNSPSLAELHSNVSLILVNSHYSLEPPRPYVTNMVQIGGFHVSETNPLPKNLQKYLDNATHGVILFSMGSNIKISTFSEEKIRALLDNFEEIAPIKVLFKSEVELKNLPTNVNISNWLPQRDILNHPNIIAFITHGGFGGTTEAVYSGVPMIGMPFFADQQSNIVEAEKEEYCVKLLYDDLTYDSFKKALKEVLVNPKYRNNIKRKSSLFKDNPIDPMKKAIFWVEHIIRHGGGKHLKNEGSNQTWYQYYLVDVALFFSVIGFIIIYITVLCLRMFLRLLFCKKKTNVSKKKVKKQ